MEGCQTNDPLLTLAEPSVVVTRCLHAATVVGDTVGDPFKNTRSVAMNPAIKFTTLFGLLAVEIAVTMTNHAMKTGRRASRLHATPSCLEPKCRWRCGRIGDLGG